ncbi:ATP-binding protein, partial [Marinobacter antarcticus]|uniref:ATP-binding protein n=1 Tax=Marinobacter antarcticus TaxID=564117 RepID=UPI0026EA79DA
MYPGCSRSVNFLKSFSHRFSRLMLALTQAKADGTYQKTLNQLSKINLLILDDWGLEALSPAHRNDL